ncbi:MAG: hypothetical protein WCO60_13955 [Verrucomicrobiota bacterium]
MNSVLLSSRTLILCLTYSKYPMARALFDAASRGLVGAAFADTSSFTCGTLGLCNCVTTLDHLSQ